MRKIKNNILLLLILFSSTLVLNGHDFLHNHDSNFESQCSSCVLSSALNLDIINSEDGLNLLSPQYTLRLIFKSILYKSNHSIESDRAPPLI